MNTSQFKTQNQASKVKIILSAIITIYGICGIIYSAVLFVKNQGHNVSINIYVIYGVFSFLFLLTGVAFLYKVLSKTNRDDTDNKQRKLYAAFRKSVNNLP